MEDEVANADQPMVGLKIKVVGVGSGSCNAIAHMLAVPIEGAEFISVNSDAKKLAACLAQTRLQLGQSGLSISRAPKARDTALDEIDKIRDVIGGASMVIVVACLGRGTGCGAGPVIARAAKDMGMLTVGIVTTPFDFEGPKRMENAREAIAAFQSAVNTLLVFENESMLDELGDDATQDEALAGVDRLLTAAVSSLVATNQGQVSAHASRELRAVLQTLGTTWWGTSTVEGIDRTQAAVASVIEKSRSAGVDLGQAKGMLITIAGASSLVRTSEQVAAPTALSALASSLAQVTCTVHFDESLGDRLRVSVLATGLSRQIDRNARPPRT